MTTTALEKLSKVLALADSDQDGEAMAALRAARTLLRTDGVNLSEVLQSALEDRRYNHVQVRGGIISSLQREVIAMQVRLSEIQRNLREQQKETQHWKRQAEENARRLKAVLAEHDRLTTRTRQMAVHLTAALDTLQGEEKQPEAPVK